MKTKYILLYAGLGTAFLAVSLWVLLSGGRSAKAVRTKYRLGGAMLTVWALLSSSNCGGPGPMVTCYEPVMPDPITYSVQGKEGLAVSNGDVIRVDCEKIMIAPYEALRIELVQGEKVLQSFPLASPLEEDDTKAVYTIKLNLPEGTRGDAELLFYITYKKENGETNEYQMYHRAITIVG